MASLKSLEGMNVSGEQVPSNQEQENLSSWGKPHTGLAVWSLCSVSALEITFALVFSLDWVSTWRDDPSTLPWPYPSAGV